MKEINPRELLGLQILLLIKLSTCINFSLQKYSNSSYAEQTCSLNGFNDQQHWNFDWGSITTQRPQKPLNNQIFLSPFNPLNTRTIYTSKTTTTRSKEIIQKAKKILPGTKRSVEKTTQASSNKQKDIESNYYYLLKKMEIMVTPRQVLKDPLTSIPQVNTSMTPTVHKPKAIVSNPLDKQLTRDPILSKFHTNNADQIMMITRPSTTISQHWQEPSSSSNVIFSKNFENDLGVRPLEPSTIPFA